MDASTRRVFYYHANATPIGGHFTLPNDVILHSHGSSSLAQAGGHAAARASNFHPADRLVSFDEAYSEIHGAPTKTGSWITEVTSVVEGLNVLGMVTADQVIAKLIVEHPANGGHAKASVAGSAFDNLVINGVKITPKLAKNALPPHKRGKYPDWSITEDPNFIKRAVTQSQRAIAAKGAPAWIKPRLSWVQSKGARRRKGYVQCSLVDKVQGAKPGSCFGHVIHVPDFGNIFLGELLTSHHVFRLTMMRLEMGCNNHGTTSIGSGDSNGSTSP
jgi:hypothetical protein